jgi:tRNA dimethylallyltransferase
MTFSRTSKEGGPFLVAIVGPTAVGKSGLAIELASRFDSAIINADSRQFYRELRIGTARPTPEEQKGVPHYLFGDRSLEEPLSAGDYEKEALPLLERLFEDHELLFLVGGSGLFLNALLHGLDDNLPPPDPRVREALHRTLEKEGVTPLLEELKEKDPEHYEQIDKRNPRRVLRALEVIRITGSPYSSFRKGARKVRPFTAIKIGLWEERSELHRRVAERVRKMLEEGLIEEVRQVLPYREHRALRTVGYQEFFPYLDGTLDLGTAKERMERNTRRYVKRQMTWFRKDEEIEWYSTREKERILARIQERTGIKARPGPAPSDT